MSLKAPNGFLPGQYEVKNEVYGAYLYLEVEDSETRTATAKLNVNQYFYADYNAHAFGGEFIAVEDDSVVLLTEKGFVFRKAINDIMYARIETVDQSTSAYATWALIGQFGSISNGWAYFLTGPLWLLIGPPAVSGISRADKHGMNIPNKRWWADMNKFARFPAGLPEGLKNVTKLKAKKYGKK